MGSKAKKTAAIVAFGLAMLATPAIAAADPGNGNSTPGDIRYNSNPGLQNNLANGNVCAGHGAFGYFGKDNNLAGGANGPATGAANSSLCGNPQGNP